MSASVESWTARMNAYAADCRAAKPLPGRGSFSDVEEQRCRIMGGALTAMLQKFLPMMLQQRGALARTMDVDPEPAVVYTADLPGLVAAREILGPEPGGVIFLHNEEFAAAPEPLADPRYQLHVHTWSQFPAELDAEFEAEARRKHPVPIGSEYWQHAEGTMWGPNAGQGGDHLWRWDGEGNPVLLEEAMRSWRA